MSYVAKRFQHAQAGLTLDADALSRYTDLIDLSIGDTDFVTDSRITEAAYRDALGGVYGLLRGVITLYVLFLLVPVIRTIIPVDLLTRYLGQSALSAIFTSDGFFARIVTGV